MNAFKKYEGIVSTKEFIEGFLKGIGGKSLSHLWEEHVRCESCVFAKQCRELNAIVADQYRNEAYPSPHMTCDEVINLLLGEVNAEDIVYKEEDYEER